MQAVSSTSLLSGPGTSSDFQIAIGIICLNILGISKYKILKTIFPPYVLSIHPKLSLVIISSSSSSSSSSLLPGLFIAGLWAIQSVVLGPPGSNGSRLPHMAWISRWTSHWLATPIISAQLLPQHIMLAGQNVG